MIHFRLRRSLRRAVDLLSLSFARSSTGPHFGRWFARRGRPVASPIPEPAAFLSWHLPWLQRPIQSPARSCVQAVGFRPRRHLASCGLLLAISLEVCGCETESISSLTLNSAFQNLPDPAPGAQPLSFYDPPEPASSLASASLSFDDPLVSPKSVLRDTRPVPWDIPESVYFIYKGHRSGKLRPIQQPVATAFVLSVPNHVPTRAPGRSHGPYTRFLVTARHVVDPQWAHCSEQNPASLELRLNRRSGGVGYETISLNAGALRRFYTPLDATADIAVIPLDQSLIPDLDNYKFIDVPFRLLLSGSEISLIRAEQQVMTARPSGELGNYPVFDGGILSTMPAETVGVHCGLPQNPGARPPVEARMLHVWFIDAGVAQGVSGAPVYTSIARIPGAAETRVLLGIQSVAWPERGMSGITPSPALADLIRSAMRDRNLNLDFDLGLDLDPDPDPDQRSNPYPPTPPLY